MTHSDAPASESQAQPREGLVTRLGEHTPALILRLAQEVLGMSTTFYSSITERELVVEGVYQDPASLAHCLVEAAGRAPLEVTYCQYVYHSGAPLVVPAAATTAPFQSLPTTSLLSIGSYVGVPLVRNDGSILGTLCGLHPSPFELSETQIVTLQLLAHALMAGMEREQLLRMLEWQRAAAAAAHQDALTGIGNRRAFDLALEAAVVRAATTGQPVALIFADIDHFKRFNDTYGHGVGDVVLRLVASRLARGLRATDQIFRYGGEEIVILLPGTTPEVADEVAERLRQMTRQAIGENERDLADGVLRLPVGECVTASFGVAVYPASAASAEALVRRADAAMYQAKRHGRDRVARAADLDRIQFAPEAGGHAPALPNAQAEALLAMLAEHDTVTGDHANRMPRLTERLVTRLGQNVEAGQLAGLAARLHDIGKVGVREAILRKAGPLNSAEWEEMRRHPEIGRRILTECGGLLSALGQVVAAHHERWDGAGYPNGLRGEQIPLASRVIAVIDAFDAMTSDRPYREALTAAAALAELRRNAGTQFDPRVVEAFMRMMTEEIGDEAAAA